MEGFERVEVKKVAGPIEGGGAVFLGNDKKTFVIFVGIFEATVSAGLAAVRSPIAL